MKYLLLFCIRYQKAAKTASVNPEKRGGAMEKKSSVQKMNIYDHFLNDNKNIQLAVGYIGSWHGTCFYCKQSEEKRDALFFYMKPDDRKKHFVAPQMEEAL